jgi:type VI secretion system protein ImpB
MPKKESIQHKIDRVRPPRVHITYDVEVGGAIENKELPFVLGVLGDFSGQPDELLPRVKDRKLVEIDRDNFDQVLAAMKPRLAYRVDNKLTNDGSKMGVELRFKSMDDFHPDNVAQQVEPLRKLVSARQRLSDLLSKMDGNDKLETILNEIASDTNAQAQLSSALGLDKPTGDEPAAKEESNE